MSVTYEERYAEDQYDGYYEAREAYLQRLAADISEDEIEDDEIYEDFDDDFDELEWDGYDD